MKFEKNDIVVWSPLHQQPGAPAVSLRVVKMIPDDRVLLRVSPDYNGPLAVGSKVLYQGGEAKVTAMQADGRYGIVINPGVAGELDHAGIERADLTLDGDKIKVPKAELKPDWEKWIIDRVRMRPRALAYEHVTLRLSHRLSHTPARLSHHPLRLSHSPVQTFASLLQTFAHRANLRSA